MLEVYNVQKEKESLILANIYEFWIVCEFFHASSKDNDKKRRLQTKWPKIKCLPTTIKTKSEKNWQNSRVAKRQRENGSEKNVYPSDIQVVACWNRHNQHFVSHKSLGTRTHNICEIATRFIVGFSCTILLNFCSLHRLIPISLVYCAMVFHWLPKLRHTLHFFRLSLLLYLLIKIICLSTQSLVEYECTPNWRMIMDERETKQGMWGETKKNRWHTIWMLVNYYLRQKLLLL